MSTKVKQLSEGLAEAISDYVHEMGLGATVRELKSRGPGHRFEVILGYVSKDNPTGDPELHNFKSMAVMYGLKEEHWNKVFILNGVAYRVCGINARSRVHPILGRHEKTGTMYKFPAESVRKALLQ